VIKQLESAKSRKFAVRTWENNLFRMFHKEPMTPKMVLLLLLLYRFKPRLRRSLKRLEVV
tara:strand:- start:123 stop:302 length:180 start_codon:yes stop_codon:yes gene_type:complete